MGFHGDDTTADSRQTPRCVKCEHGRFRQRSASQAGPGRCHSDSCCWDLTSPPLSRWDLNSQSCDVILEDICATRWEPESHQTGPAAFTGSGSEDESPTVLHSEAPELEITHRRVLSCSVMETLPVLTKADLKRLLNYSFRHLCCYFNYSVEMPLPLKCISSDLYRFFLN